MNQDEKHLDLLAVFHYVVGGLTAFFACIPLVHVAVGIVAVLGAFDGDDAPPVMIGCVFIIIGATFVLVGWAIAIAIIIAGRRLAKRRSWTYCLVVAAIECTFQPFGTVLGVFTIVVLCRDSVRRLFMAHDEPDAGGNPFAQPAN